MGSEHNIYYALDPLHIFLLAHRMPHRTHKGSSSLPYSSFDMIFYLFLLAYKRSTQSIALLNLLPSNWQFMINTNKNLILILLICYMTRTVKIYIQNAQYLQTKHLASFTSQYYLKYFLNKHKDTNQTLIPNEYQ